MRIAILTQPLRYNYGGILQNFALQTVLRRMGHDVVTLDSRRYLYPKWKYPYVFLRHAAARYLKGHPEVPILGEYIKDKVPRTLGKNTYPFIDKYIKRKEYTNLANDIRPGDFDVFIVGSDQVWRPEYNMNLPNMFLDFTKGWNIKRLAYAASFGVDAWSADEETTEKCREGIRRFDLVTVREDSGVDLCNQLFGVEAQHVLDPTLLLTKEDYVKLLKLDKVQKSPGDLLVYILDYTDEKRQLVDKIAKDYHLTPFRVNSDVENYHSEIERRIQPPVKQWLRGFYDAKYVITDSFHACAFSILFGKRFIAVGNQCRGLTRFTSLLKKLNLDSCLIMESSGFVGFQDISQESIQILSPEREKVFSCLRQILNKE